MLCGLSPARIFLFYYQRFIDVSTWPVRVHRSHLWLSRREIEQMRKPTYSLASFVLMLLVAAAMAQDSAQERAANLRAQLTDLQAQQADLQSRLTRLDEDIKPENIERSLAGIGSTHPEDLREARRRQLEIQRKGIQSQLDNLATTRARLEAAIPTTDPHTYRETVGPNSSGDITPTPKSTKAIVNRNSRQKHRLKRRKLHRY